MLAILMFLFAALIPTTAPVAAQDEAATPAATPTPLQFGLYPVGNFENRYFEVDIEAGTSRQLTAGIVNAGAEPIALRTFATNAINPPNGGFAAETEEDQPTGPTLWLDYPAESFELHPGERRETTFTVTVPADTAPGHYVAALVVRTEGSLPIPGSETFQQVIRNAMSVEITVPGPQDPGFALGLPEFSNEAAVLSLNIPIENTGNVLVKPAGDLVVTTPDGKEVLTAPVKMGSVYGGASTTIEVSLPQQFPTGDYLVSAMLVDDATAATASIEAIPVTLAERAEEKPALFSIDQASVRPNGDPVQYADVSATITNNGQTIPTASVTLNVQRNGEEVESYPLALNQALPQGSTAFSQRYIPVSGWQEGTYTFHLVIAAVSDGTETILATVDIADDIVIP